MPRVHRPLVAVIAVLVVAGGLAAEAHRSTREPTAASAPSSVSGRGFDALPQSVALAGRDTRGDEGAEPPSPPPPSEPRDVVLRSFPGCEPLLAHVRGEAVARVTEWGLPDASGRRGDVAVADAAVGAPARSTSGGTAATTGYSTTNVQEAGVDEPDIVKNDATRVFTAFDGRLRSHVIDADGINHVAAVSLPAARTTELLLVGDRLVVLSDPYAEGRERTRVQLFDVADPSVLELVHDYEIDGTYVSAREVHGVIRIVTTASPNFPFAHPEDGQPESRARALEHNRALVGSSPVEEWIPEIREIITGDVAPAATCAEMHATVAFSGFGTTTVLTLDPATGSFGRAASVLSDAHEVYASPDRLYVATAAWPGPGDDRARFPAPEETQIHQFDISDPAGAVYTASGTVPGHLIRPFLWGGGSNMAQWAMSHYDGHLRVANTVGERGSSVSSVTVLRREGKLLVPVGLVEGLGAGERIYSVRFMADRGYVVTYREVDPLYVLDLADPTSPRLRGELKVPGYSAYLHPMPGGRLLGVGQEDANEDGMVEGLQASLFDVRDPGSPRQLDRIQLGPRGTTSLVESDSRAFTWWPAPARAVLPVMSWDAGGFVGAITLAVNDDTLAELGRVDHTSPDDDGCRFPVQRSRVFGESIYTFSAGGVARNSVEDFAPEAKERYDDAAQSCVGPYESEPPPPSTTSTTTTTTTVPGSFRLP